MRTRIQYDNGLALVIENGSGRIIKGLPREEADKTPNIVDCNIDDCREYNAAMDGIESLVLALACAGVNITSLAFVSSLDTALEACGNNL